MNEIYLATARLLTEAAPFVFESGVFALKGGTAINLFLRDMPRLSVDLDLVFTDHRLPRADTLVAINDALRACRARLTKRGLKVQALSAADMGETRLLIQRGALSVKVEVNTVIRGTVHPTQTKGLSAAASDALMADVELPLLSTAEIYGGKLVAAMDRQHPRDFFDVMELFAHGGITPGIRRAFILANAMHIRNVSGRKSDVNDATWIADLLAHGLIRSSFVPPAPIQELRDLTRSSARSVIRRIARNGWSAGTRASSDT